MTVIQHRSADDMNRTDAPPVPGRPLSIESPTNRYFIHAVARRLVPHFARLGVSPNGVSAIGLAAGLVAAGFYYHYERPFYAVLGFVFTVIWHIMDGADGQLARLTGRQSEFGKFVDGVCDYGAVAAVYIALGLGYLRNEGDIVIVPLFLLAGVSHIVQAALYEGRRQFFGDCLNDSAPVSAPPSRALTPGWRQWLWKGPLWLYGKLQSLNAANTRIQAICRDSAEARQNFIRQQVPLMRRWNLLANNLRAGLILLSCLLATPIYYFVYELVLANLILVLLVLAQRRADSSFLAMQDA